MKLNSQELKQIAEEVQLAQLSTIRKMVKQEIKKAVFDGITVKLPVQEEEVSIPARAGEPWIDFERQQLHTALPNWDLLSIAKRHQRTLSAIIWELKHECDRGNL